MKKLLVSITLTAIAQQQCNCQSAFYFDFSIIKIILNQ